MNFIVSERQQFCLAENADGTKFSLLRKHAYKPAPARCHPIEAGGVSCDLAVIRQFKTRASSLKSLRQKVASECNAELLEFWLLDAASPGHLPWPTENAGYGLSYSSDPIEQRWLELYLRLEHDVPGLNRQPTP